MWAFPWGCSPTCSVWGIYRADGRRPVCMVAMTTVAAVAAVAGALLVVAAYLLFTYGKYRRGQKPGVVDMNDYQNTRLQIQAVWDEGVEDGDQSGGSGN